MILISIAIAISRPLLVGANPSLHGILASFLEMMGSAGLGAAVGWAMCFAFRHIPKTQVHWITLTLSVVLCTAGLSRVLHLSALITCLTMGFVVLNFSSIGGDVMSALEAVATPILLLFFTIAGGSLQPSLIIEAGPVVAVYIVTRTLAKLVGVRLGARVSGMSSSVSGYLPTCLLSQAGTTIGLTMIVAQQLPEVASRIVTVMLSAVLFFEVIAPPFTRSALIRLGEAECTGE